MWHVIHFVCENVFQKKFPNIDHPCGIAITSKGQLVVADRDNNRLALVDRTSGKILKTMPISQPYGVTVTADGTYICLPSSCHRKV